MGNGSYYGGSTKISLRDKAWKSEVFGTRKTIKKMQMLKKSIKERSKPNNIALQNFHITDTSLLKKAIVERKGKILGWTVEILESKLYNNEIAVIFRNWLTPNGVPFVINSEGFVKFSWKKARAIAEDMGIRNWTPNPKTLSAQDLSILERISYHAIGILSATQPPEREINKLKKGNSY